MELLGKATCDHRVGNPIVTYQLSTCPRCLGNGIYGGVSYDSGGLVQTLAGVAQLEQQIQKALVENMRESGYGFNYGLLRGVIDSSTVATVRNEIARCITYLYNLQQQSKREGFRYRPDEEIDKIQSIDVSQSTTEPRTVIAAMVVLTTSGAQASVMMSLRR